MKEKSARAVSIIGGADGPTSVFRADKSGKKPLKVRIKHHVYKCRRKKMEKMFFACSHTIEEVIAKIPDYEMPMDFHLYKIRLNDGGENRNRLCLGYLQRVL